MRRIAVSGHRGLPARTVELIDEQIQALLSGYAPDVVGVSCLADGADQVFARAVADLGGRIEVIVPAERYREELPEDAHGQYDRLLAQAVSVRRLPFGDSTSESHMAASKLIVGEADELYAVWDGKPARSFVHV